MKTIRKTEATNYAYIHDWNCVNCPKSGLCLHCGKWTKTEWALIHGRIHQRGVKNYKELCRKCHVAYDRTPEWIEKNKESLKQTYSHQNPIKPKRCLICDIAFIPRRKTTRFCSNSCSGKWRYKQGLTKLRLSLQLK